MANPRVFAARMSLHARSVELNAGNALRNTVNVIATTLIRFTPVGGPPNSPDDPHPGLARSNWEVRRNPARFFGPVMSETDTINRALAASRQFRADDEAFISNAVPYINRLNSGSSTQAPAGFVNAAARIGASVVQNARLLRRPRRR